MIRREIVLIGHGSRVEEAVGDFNKFAHSLSSYLKMPANACFLELSEPDIQSGLSAAARRAGAGGEVLAIPMFLGTAYHMKAEISAAIRHLREDFPGVLIHYSTALGFHLKLAELLRVRVEEALARNPHALPAQDTFVLVVGGGSSDLDSNSSVSKTARVLAELADYAGVEVAYQRVTRPTTAQGIERCHKLGARQIVVAPYLLFTGIVRQKTDAAARESAASFELPLIHADPLGPSHPLLLEVVAQRLREAADGVSALLRRRMVEGLPQTLTAAGHSHAHHHGEHAHNHEVL